MNNPKIRLRNYLSQDRYIRLSRSLTKKLGTDAAILIGELIDWENYLEEKDLLEPDQYFYMEQKYIEERTGISPYIQRGARTLLEKNSLIKYERRGTPPRYYYKINHDEVESLILSYTPSQTGSDVPVQRLMNLTFKDKVSLPLKDIEPNRIEPNVTSKSKELRSFNSSVIAVSPGGSGETVAPSEGLEIIPPLIKRDKSISVEFEKNPRQRYRSDVLDIINYWNSSPGLMHHKVPPTMNGKLTTPTKTFLNAVSTVGKVLDGKFFTAVGLSNSDRVYNKKEIITAIDRFKLMATNPSYLPMDKTHLRKVGLNIFFHNPFSDHIASYFLKCLEEEPKHVVTVVERQKEKNPQLTIWLKDIYREKVLLGTEKEFNPIEENKIIKGANQLHETMRRLNGRLNMMTRPIEWVNIFIDSLIERWGTNGIYPGHLCADHSFDDVLVRYLKRKGRLG